MQYEQQQRLLRQQDLLRQQTGENPGGGVGFVGEEEKEVGCYFIYKKVTVCACSAVHRPVKTLEVALASWARRRKRWVVSYLCIFQAVLCILEHEVSK